MPEENKAVNDNSTEDKIDGSNSDVNNLNTIVGDNSSLSTTGAVQEQSEKSADSFLKTVAENKSTGAKLIPFLCYAKENSTSVREFRERLKAEDWVDPWFDEEDILPGQMWEGSVTDAVHNSHAVIVFLSSIAVRTEGFFHKELKLALDAAAEKPDGTIFIMPIRLDACDVPDRLQPYQYVDYFGDEVHKDRVYSSLIAALKFRAENLGIKMSF